MILVMHWLTFSLFNFAHSSIFFSKYKVFHSYIQTGNMLIIPYTTHVCNGPHSTGGRFAPWLGKTQAKIYMTVPLGNNPAYAL